MEQILQEVVERWTIINEALPIAINFWDEDLNFIDGNEMGYKLFEFPNKEYWKENWQDSMPEFQPDGSPSLEKMSNGFKKTVRKGNHRFEWLHYTISGEPIPLDINMVRVKYKDGYMVVCIMQDLRIVRESDAKIREAHELTQMILDSAPFVINLWDKSGTLLQTSHHALELHNVSSKEEYVQNFFKLSPKHQACGTLTSELVPHYLNLAFQEGYARFEWMHCTMDGKPIPTEITLVRFERQGEFMLVAYTTDLTLAKAAMNMERERELHERVRLFFDASPMGVSVYDENYRLVDCNRSAVTMFGFGEKKDFVAEFDRPYPVLSPEYQPCGTRSTEKAAKIFKKISIEGYAQFEWMHYDANGNEFPTETTIVIVPYKNTFEIVSYIRDLREIRAAQEKEREAFELTQALLDSAPFAIGLTDQNANVLMVSKYVTELFGIDDPMIFAKKLYDFSPPYQPCGTPTPEKAAYHFMEAFEKGRTKFEWMHKAPDGGPMPVEVVYITFMHKGQKMLVSYTTDMREIKAAQEALEVARQQIFLAELAEESSKAKSRFLARMSHEIRTPITTVLGIAEIELRNTNLSPQLEESFAKIYSSSNILPGQQHLLYPKNQLI